MDVGTRRGDAPNSNLKRDVAENSWFMGHVPASRFHTHIRTFQHHKKKKEKKKSFHVYRISRRNIRFHYNVSSRFRTAVGNIKALTLHITTQPDTH